MIRDRVSTRFVLSDYLDQAMAAAVYDKLEDGAFVGRIPLCRGVISFAATLHECEAELRSMGEHPCGGSTTFARVGVWVREVKK